MPKVGTRSSIKRLITGTAYSPVAAGSPGPLARKTPSGSSAQQILGLHRRGHDRDLAAPSREQPQDIALHAIVDGDHVETRLGLMAISVRPGPFRLLPGVALEGSDERNEVEPGHRGQSLGLGGERAEVEDAILVMRDHGIRHAFVADESRERARIDAADADDATRHEPFVEAAPGPPIRRLGDRLGEHHAAHARGGRHVDRLDILVIHPDIADMREGEGDDLPRIGGVGQDLLIAGHGRVEADFAGSLARRADSRALDHHAVGEDEQGRDARLAPLAAAQRQARARVPEG